MEQLIDYENIEPFSNPDESISDKKNLFNFEDAELSAEHLAKSLARIFLATHKRKIDKALEEFNTDM